MIQCVIHIQILPFVLIKSYTCFFSSSLHVFLVSYIWNDFSLFWHFLRGLASDFIEYFFSPDCCLMSRSSLCNFVRTTSNFLSFPGHHIRRHMTQPISLFGNVNCGNPWNVVWKASPLKNYNFPCK